MLILSNAKIYTLDPDHPATEALALVTRPDGSGRILAVGTTNDLKKEFPRATEQNMGGRAILPGLTDAHMHLMNYGLNLEMVNVDTPTLKECLDRVAARARELKPGAWIRGHGWRQNDWAQGFGTAAMLDETAPNNPVYLTAASLHAAWANHAALKAAGVGRETPDPPNGRIQRDAGGEPTGILFEAPAMNLVADVIPPPSDEGVLAAVEAAQQRLWRMGITAVHDFDRRRSFVALQTLHGRGGLKLRVVKSIPDVSLDHALELGLRSGFGDHMLRIGAVKVFADGALGPRTAAMLEPYIGEPENRGMLFLDAEELLEIGQRAASGGLSMAVHAIGDRANHEVLNAFEQLRAFERERSLLAYRHRIEHVQILHRDDVARLAQLKVAASMQPIHATADMQAADALWGPRAEFAYAWRAQLEAGALLAFGSDAPVETPNPFAGIHAALTRRRADADPNADGWYPQQRLTLSEALTAYTQGPAILAGMEGKLGKLAPGYFADLIVLEQDPFETPPQDLHTLTPTATMLGGEWVWRSE